MSKPPVIIRPGSIIETAINQRQRLRETLPQDLRVWEVEFYNIERDSWTTGWWEAFEWYIRKSTPVY